MNLNQSLNKSFQISVLIAKLVIPFSILSEILQYFDCIKYIAFVFEPLTSILSLDASVAVAFAASFFLNIYAGIAVAASLDLNSYEWTIVGTFIAICHSIPLEATVLKKVGFSIAKHWMVRLTAGLVGAWFASVIVSENVMGTVIETIHSTDHTNVWQMLLYSVKSAMLLTIKIILLVVGLALIFDYLKSRPSVGAFIEKHSYASSLTVGGLLGVTYGAGILLNDIQSVTPKHKNLLLWFLLLAHGLVEETFIFMFFGADVATIFLIRLSIALIVVLFVHLLHKLIIKNSSFEVIK